MSDGQNEVARHDIAESGIYVLVMAMCDPESLPVVVDGAIESVDPCKCASLDVQMLSNLCCFQYMGSIILAAYQHVGVNANGLCTR